MTSNNSTRQLDLIYESFSDRTQKLSHDWKMLQKEINKKPFKIKPAHQQDVNVITDSIFKICLEIEALAPPSHDLAKEKENFKRDFSEFVRSGSFNRHVQDRPYGYPGDFYIIDKIYLNEVAAIGFEGCMDAYFLNSPASVATRNRKEDFKSFLKESIERHPSQNIRIMDLASGSCRDLQEFFLNLTTSKDKTVTFDCIDHDHNAIDYAKMVLGNYAKNVNFQQKNALRWALSKNIEKTVSNKYDIIFSTGLFDYFDDILAAKLLKNLRLCLKTSGLLIISNYRESWRNGSRIFMEWGVDWPIYHRSDDEFINLFLTAGFIKDKIYLKYEKQGIMQYCFATA